MKYNVIDIDPAMHYDAPGDEVIGTVEADSSDEAIKKVMVAIGVDYLRAYSPSEYAFHILSNVSAVAAD
jgi:hypothetical protein